MALICAELASQMVGVYKRLQSGELNPSLYFCGVFEALPPSITSWLDRFGLVDFGILQQRLSDRLAQGSQFLATQVRAIGQNTLEFAVDLAVTLYLAFFLIRDGQSLASELRHALPLAPAHRRELFEKFTVVIRAIVKGNLLVASLQGLLGGLAFWFLGVNGALLWAVVMAFLSLVPAVGAALVWPWAAWRCSASTASCSAPPSPRCSWPCGTSTASRRQRCHREQGAQASHPNRAHSVLLPAIETSLRVRRVFAARERSAPGWRAGLTRDSRSKR